MKLKSKTYTYQEIKEFEREYKTKDIQFLLENVSALRILGWKLILPKKISHEYINGFSDVIQVDRTLKQRGIVYKGKQYDKK